MQSGGTTGTMSWFSRGAMRNQYETGVIKATYGYTDINNNLRVAQDAAGLTTSTYDGDNLRRKIVSGSVTTTFVWDGADYLQIKPSTGDATLLIALEGEVVGHVKGSEKRDYIVDPLGSVVAYLNSSQTLTDQFEYWPYGEMVAEVEAGTEPFLWVGSLGYFRDSDLRTYILAREYRQDLGSWMQLDPLWPHEAASTYCRSRPTTFVDPMGLAPQCVLCALCAGGITVGLLLACMNSKNKAGCAIRLLQSQPALALTLAGCLGVCASCLSPAVSAAIARSIGSGRLQPRLAPAGGLPTFPEEEEHRDRMECHCRDLCYRFCAPLTVAYEYLQCQDKCQSECLLGDCTSPFYTWIGTTVF